MDKEKKRMFDSLMKFFEEKGYKKEELEELAEKEMKQTKSKKTHRIVKITDLKDMLKKSEESFSDRPAFKYKTDVKGEIAYITYKDFIDDVNSLGTELINLGLKGKKIAVIGENRYEWAVAYLAISCGTGMCVPLDKSLPANELESLIIRSGVEAIFYSNKYDEIMQNIKKNNTTDLRYYISMDLNERTNGVYSETELINKGKLLLEQGNYKFINAKIDADKSSFMIFTSGTTAMSKAVLLSHKNIVTNLMDIASVIEISKNDTLLSFLPLHHTFECTVGFLEVIYKGGSIAYCDGIRHIADNIKEYKITQMISVPALYENMYKRIMKTIEKKGKLQSVQKGVKIANALQVVGIDIRKKLFKEIHDNLGGRVRLFVAGGAALDPEAEKGFNALGVKMLQGYGLTETSPVIAAEDDKYQRLGSIGKAFPSLDVKIVDANEEGIGELVVKGPTTMIGYYNNEEATKETIDSDGWLHTGDLARIDKDGFIFISGRKKFVIVLKNGKNIYPEELEALVNKIEGVKESFVYGKPEDDGDYTICVKVQYDRDAVKEAYNVEDEEDIKEALWQEVKKINKTMPAYKYIREIKVTEEDFIKTTTQKIKRNEEIKKVL